MAVVTPPFRKAAKPDGAQAWFMRALGASGATVAPIHPNLLIVGFESRNYIFRIALNHRVLDGWPNPWAGQLHEVDSPTEALRIMTGLQGK